MNRFIVLLLATLLALPAVSFAATPTVEELQKQIADIVEELDDLNDRVDVTETHTATDKISFSGDLRNTVDSLHYQDVTFNPGIKVDFDQFIGDFGAGNLGALTSGVMIPLAGAPAGTMTIDPTAGTGTPLDNLMINLYNNDPNAAIGLASMLASVMGGGPMPGVQPFRLATAPHTSDINNDLAYTTRLRLNMKADVSHNMNFAGRLLMYKNWGDSTTSKVFDSWDAFTMDGTSGGKTSGDWLRVERAFFNWKHILGSDFYFSVGRRPSTYGPPSNYRVNEMRGGTPSGHLVDFNFDGFTIGYHMDKITGIEGQALRFCYGQGFESELGNGTMFNDDITANLKDTQLGGFNIDLFNDGQTFIQTTLFRAQDVVDGFKGTFAFPAQYAALFAPTINADTQKFPNMNFVVRYTPTTVIGDINLAQLGFSREEDNGFVWFGTVGVTQLVPNGEAGMFGGLGTDAVYEAQLNNDGSEVIMMPARAEDDDTQNGYGVYVGIRVPAPMGKFGLEYNYGSEYWTPFTQNQDDLLGSKLATRGHVGEAYYIFDINPHAFIKIGGLYYDYEYTGSGSPVGKPVKIDDLKKGTAYSLLPAVDKAWDAYAKITMKF